MRFGLVPTVGTEVTATDENSDIVGLYYMFTMFHLVLLFMEELPILFQPHTMALASVRFHHDDHMNAHSSFFILLVH